MSGKDQKWRFLSTGRPQHIKCYTSGPRTYTNVQDRVVSERSGNLNQGKRGDSLASQEASYKRLVVLAALTVRTGSRQIFNPSFQCHFGPAHVYKRGYSLFHQLPLNSGMEKSPKLLTEKSSANNSMILRSTVAVMWGYSRPSTYASSWFVTGLQVSWANVYLNPCENYLPS